MIFNILYIGDIIGSTGRKAVARILPGLIKDESIHFVIANGENAAGGFGITPPIVEELTACGINAFTTGNHVWDKKDIIPYLSTHNNVLRPANYPNGTPGTGSAVFSANGENIGVLQVMGRVFMLPLNCPFRTAEIEIQKLKHETDIIIVDIHAEASSEKTAFARYLDGKVSAVIGTHTHVQTADERILKGGTAYITDAGMTGPEESVIGMSDEQSIKRLITQLPARFEVAEGESTLCGVIISVETATAKSTSIKRIRLA